jgi:hypothetical protein
MLKLLPATVLAAAMVAVAPLHAQTVDGPTVNWRLGAWGKPRAATAGTEYIKKYRAA